MVMLTEAGASAGPGNKDENKKDDSTGNEHHGTQPGDQVPPADRDAQGNA